jgi:hypothetical protein
VTAVMGTYPSLRTSRARTLVYVARNRLEIDRIREVFGDSVAPIKSKVTGFCFHSRKGLHIGGFPATLALT